MTADLTGAAGKTAWLPAKSPGSALSEVGTDLMLRKLHPPLQPGEKEIIKFAFNPEKINVSHAYKTEGATGASLSEQIMNLGFVEISLDKAYITGEDTQSDCETLLAWTNPVLPVAIGLRGQEQKAQPVLLSFTWGTGLTYQVSMRSVSINYVRFAGATGIPIRAEVSLKLYENLNKNLPSTNPTSGGPPGRSTHVLDSSECLPSLAAASYGRPGAWRSIASANGIDDPLRVRPGTLVYLPEPGGSGNGAGGKA
jgi:nucleoid-associated protein YgaU